jgi:dynein heavy chain, axonemal
MRAVKSVIAVTNVLKRLQSKASLPEASLSELALLQRAIRMQNEARFVPADLVLFEGIMKAVFPGVDCPMQDSASLASLRKGVHSHCRNEGIQPTDVLITHVKRLQDTLSLRHGVMLLGPPYGAKTTVRNALAAAESAASGGRTVMQTAVNPWAISEADFYGFYHSLTFEWHHGIFSCLFRNAMNDKSHRQHWLILDGPVDASWVENLNTVCDDNKKLCLASGEMIPLLSHMRVIFEAADVAVASPATVSRLGMVYCDASLVGWEPLVASWLERLPEPLKAYKSTLDNLFLWLVSPCLDFVAEECSTYTKTGRIQRVHSLLRLMDAMLLQLDDGLCAHHIRTQVRNTLTLPASVSHHVATRKLHVSTDGVCARMCDQCAV